MLGVYFWLMAWRFFDRRRQGESIGVLAGLTVAATLLAVVSEMLWPASTYVALAALAGTLVGGTLPISGLLAVALAGSLLGMFSAETAATPTANR